jgi:inosine-uridine nucleoside N-ribohydrolase
VRFHEEREGLRGAVINDPLAVALAVAPEWGEAEPFRVRVDRSPGPQRGRTAAGQRDAGDPVVRAYRRFDRAPVHEVLLEHLFGRWLTPADFAA